MFTALALFLPGTLVTPASAQTDNEAPLSQENGHSIESPLASSESNGENEHIQSVTANVLELTRSDSGLTKITVEVNNNSDRNLHDNRFSNPIYDYREPIFSGITLADHNIQTRFHPLMDKENFCLCSGYVPRLPYTPYVKPEESVDYWAMYSIPEDVKNVDVEIPGFDPIEDVPVE
ncbi:hypothetical protein [Streptomonospora alba]|uniref:hypothetical protein n=1 Tax=Streptomonospora alba TaxID=183763 RepID=UPI001EE76F6B|nr:hypothetical protein [Streptomonospora alba]